MRTFLIILAATLLSITGTVLYLNSQGPGQAAAQETAYERVMRTSTIRCAYSPYAPALIKDPNTGEMSGIFYETVNEIGRRLGLKVEWTEEVGYGVIAEGFNTHRYDAFCNTVWPTAERSREASFTLPVYYSQVGLYVRADDHRFDDDFTKLNSPDVTFVVKDGDVSDAYKNDMFPLAKKVSIPQLADTGQLIEDVANGKADVAVNEPMLLIEYSKANPSKVRNLAEGHPISVSPNTIMLPKNEYQLKMMFDVALTELHNNGFIARTIARHDPERVFLPVAKPYLPNAAQ
jgi:ABC-type amino acid transport substrate-binding protein